MPVLLQQDYQWSEGAWISFSVVAGKPHVACSVSLRKCMTTAADGPWCWLMIGSLVKWQGDSNIYLVCYFAAYPGKFQNGRKTP